MSLDWEAMHADELKLEDAPAQVFSSYAEAAEQAAQTKAPEGFVVRVQRSPYARGYVVRSLPIAFLTNPYLRHRAHTLDYNDIDDINDI